jgi:hypothetical protein
MQFQQRLTVSLALIATSFMVACAAATPPPEGGGAPGDAARGGGAGAAAGAEAGAAEFAGTWVSADGSSLTLTRTTYVQRTVYRGGSYREVAGRITSHDAGAKRFTVEYERATEDGKKAEFTPGTRYVIYERYGERIRIYAKRDDYAPASNLKEDWYTRQQAAP